MPKTLGIPNHKPNFFVRFSANLTKPNKKFWHWARSIKEL